MVAKRRALVRTSAVPGAWCSVPGWCCAVTGGTVGTARLQGEKREELRNLSWNGAQRDKGMRVVVRELVPSCAWRQRHKHSASWASGSRHTGCGGRDGECWVAGFGMDTGISTWL